MNVNINITNRDGSCHPLERKDHIKYLGVMIDSSLTWKSTSQILTQIYYNHIYLSFYFVCYLRFSYVLAHILHFTACSSKLRL